MAVNYYFNYAEIDPETNMCIGMQSCSMERTETEYFVAIPVNDPEYLCKYYINGEWYEDAEGTIPWVSALL
jgi:hypothetical protein